MKWLLPLTLLFSMTAFAEGSCESGKYGVALLKKLTLAQKSSAALDMPMSLRERMLKVADLDIWYERKFSGFDKNVEILDGTLTGFRLLKELGVPDEEISKLAEARIKHHFDRLEKLSTRPAGLSAGSSTALPVPTQVIPEWIKNWKIDELVNSVNVHGSPHYVSGGYDMEHAFELASRYIHDPESKAAKTIMVYMARADQVRSIIAAADKASANEYLLWAGKYSLGKAFLENPDSNYFYWGVDALQRITGPASAEAKLLLKTVADHLLETGPKDTNTYSNILKTLRSTGDLVDRYPDAGSTIFIHDVKGPATKQKIKTVVSEMLKNPEIRAVDEIEKSIYAIQDQALAETTADHLAFRDYDTNGTRLLLYATAGAKEKFEKVLDQMLHPTGPTISRPLSSLNFNKYYLPAAKRIGDEALYQKLIELRKVNFTDGPKYFEFYYGKPGNYWSEAKPYSYNRSQNELNPIEFRLKNNRANRESIQDLVAQGDANLKRKETSEALSRYVDALKKLKTNPIPKLPPVPQVQSMAPTLNGLPEPQTE